MRARERRKRAARARKERQRSGRKFEQSCFLDAYLRRIYDPPALTPAQKAEFVAKVEKDATRHALQLMGSAVGEMAAEDLRGPYLLAFQAEMDRRIADMGRSYGDLMFGSGAGSEFISALTDRYSVELGCRMDSWRDNANAYSPDPPDEDECGRL